MKTSGPFHTYKRQDTKKYHLTLYPASGLRPSAGSMSGLAAEGLFPPSSGISRLSGTQDKGRRRCGRPGAYRVPEKSDKTAGGDSSNPPGGCEPAG
jgi:hypothetical protein